MKALVSRLDNTIGGVSREGNTCSETHLLPLMGIQQNQQANSNNIYAESLMQTYAGPLLGASISVSP